jgi:hypothetical protein
MRSRRGNTGTSAATIPTAPAAYFDQPQTPRARREQMREAGVPRLIDWPASVTRALIRAELGREIGTRRCRRSAYAPVNRYSVCQASFGSVWAVQKSSAMLSGSKSVPGLTAPIRRARPLKSSPRRYDAGATPT